MTDFNDEFLHLKPGTITYYPTELDHPVAGTWSMVVPLEPFSADDEYEPETFRPGRAGPELVETEFSLDFISLPATGLTELSGRVFTFPADTDEGHIDGSIYLVATHNPVNVTRIEFGEASNDEIPVTLRAELVLETVDMNNRTAVLETRLHFHLGRLTTS